MKNSRKLCLNLCNRLMLLGYRCFFFCCILLYFYMAIFFLIKQNVSSTSDSQPGVHVPLGVPRAVSGGPEDKPRNGGHLSQTKYLREKKKTNYFEAKINNHA
uniref:(northern house mosquito) hypothetical protein n=1 Tax=Culex pipiens TaxID=7175 RepID=A0A8D8G697_CULPI